MTFENIVLSTHQFVRDDWVPSCFKPRELTIIPCRLNYERKLVRYHGIIYEGGKHKFWDSGFMS